LLANKSFADGAFWAISCHSKSAYSSVFMREAKTLDGKVSFLLFKVVTA
jgi:hypothetical protein